jgi:hypothetical protein
MIVGEERDRDHPACFNRIGVVLGFVVTSADSFRQETGSDN